MNLRERILSNPTVFRAFKALALPTGGVTRIVDEYLKPGAGESVLDLGCGYGDYAPILTPGCTYLGIDHNAAYIERARHLNADNGATFLVADVSDPVVVEHGPYDLVMMSGVMHHLPSDVVRCLGKTIARLLTASGRFVAVEPVFDPSQGLAARMVIAADRGRHVRDEEGYRHLLEPSFPNIDTIVVDDLLRFPYTHVIITANG